MLVPNQIIKVKVNASSISHYKEKGYSVEMNKVAEIKAEDLTMSSDKKVKVICDYCNKELEKAFQKYTKQREIVEKDACFDCFPLKQRDVCNEKYGVDSTMQLQENKDKSKITNLNKYGVDNPMKCEDIKEKFRETMIDRHGVEYAQQSEDIRDKTKKTYIRKYGVEHPMYLKEIRKKVNDFEFVNGVKVSYPQKYLSTLLKGALNLNVSGFFCDIGLIEDKIIVEYDGSGHNLSVKLGKISQDDFDAKENDRFKTLTESGWKCLIIKNAKERKFTDEILDDIDKNIDLLKYTNNKIIKYKIS